MKEEDRGMKKWAPYKSLIEQGAALNKLRYQKNKIEKPKISNERAEEINSILSFYDNETLAIKYFKDGYLYWIDGKLDKIDPLFTCLEINKHTIAFKDIIAVIKK